MILARDQINRYLRHIIIPEVSGPGQKKLLASAVFIGGENVAAIAPAVYYLAAAGVGRISCRLAETEGFDRLSAGIHDLNGDVSIGLSDGGDSDFGLFLGGPEFILQQRPIMVNGFVPSVVAFYNGWRGGRKVFAGQEGLNSFLAGLADAKPAAGTDRQAKDLVGEGLSICLAGALGAMEVMKLALGIGVTDGDSLFFDLLTNKFFKAGKEDWQPALNDLYTWPQPDGPDRKLADKKVLIVGTGGLGSPAAYALARTGIGTIGLVDYDVVEISNLQRQILHSTSRIGLPKVESAAVFLKNFNPQLKVNTYNTSINKDNIFTLLAAYDAVIDGVDNFPTRFLLNDACVLARKPLIDAGVIRFDGTCQTIVPPEGPCYRCTLPDIPSPGSVPSCSESGVLSSLPGIMGFIQAAETVKLLTGQGSILSDQTIFFDGLSSEFLTIKISKNNACPLCGTDPTIHELQEYAFVCPDTVHNKQE